MEQKSASPSPFEQSSAKNIINLIAFKYLPFWPIFVLTIIASIGIAYVYIHYQTPIYEANASILLKDKQTDESTVLEALGAAKSQKTVENEIEVLKSRDLMRSVVKKMKLYTLLYAKGNLRDVLIYPSPIEFTALQPDKLPSTGPIAFDYLEAERMVTLNGTKYPVNVPVNTPYGMFIFNINKQFWPNQQPKGERKPLYLILRDVKSAAKGIIGSLQVSMTAKQSTLIGLKFTDPIPQRAEDILNGIINVYNIEGIEDKNLMAERTLEFIRQKLDTVGRELSTVENKYQEYRSSEGIVSLSDEAHNFLSNTNLSDQKIADIQVQLDILGQIEKYIVKKGQHPGTVPATIGLNNIQFNAL